MHYVNLYSSLGDLNDKNMGMVIKHFGFPTVMSY